MHEAVLLWFTRSEIEALDAECIGKRNSPVEFPSQKQLPDEEEELQGKITGHGHIYILVAIDCLVN